MRGFGAILRKEARQMLRDKGTLRLTLVVPLIQLVLFGLIDTNVRHVPTVVFDQSHTQESRQLVSDLVDTSFFSVIAYVGSRSALREEIVAGRAAVGFEIPPEYARQRLYERPANFLVLIDGSDATISGQTLQAASSLALERSLEDLATRQGIRNLPIQANPLVLFNPDSRTANLLIPGLIAILLTFSGTLLSAFAIVRERERGTLEQLMVTPVSPLAVVLGKILPYLVLAFCQMIFVLLLMRWVFLVPIHGSLPLLLGLSIVYLFSLLSLGLLISSRSTTQMEAMQGAQLFLLPSIMLSGYVFPLSSLPPFLRVISTGLPATHFIAISRGIIIRGASFVDLWEHVVALLIIAAVLVAFSARAFRKTIS
jgi:ABC-2 type transport system permease protein